MLAAALVALLDAGLVGYGLGLRDGARELAELRRRHVGIMERRAR